VTVAIARFMAVTIDAVDARALASFWTALLDTEIEADLGDGQYIFLAGRGGLELCLQRVPEPKASKDRVHLDLAVDDLEVATAHVIELGRDPGRGAASLRTRHLAHDGRPPGQRVRPDRGALGTGSAAEVASGRSVGTIGARSF
jgi:glyoxalase superfamily protein